MRDETQDEIEENQRGLGKEDMPGYEPPPLHIDAFEIELEVLIAIYGGGGVTAPEIAVVLIRMGEGIEDEIREACGKSSTQ